MIKIILGHIIGFLTAYFFFNIKEPTSDSFLFILIGILVLLGFIYFQLFRSIKTNSIYWRGVIDYEISPTNFYITQICYSIIAGFLIISSILSFL